MAEFGQNVAEIGPQIRYRCQPKLAQACRRILPPDVGRNRSTFVDAGPNLAEMKKKRRTRSEVGQRQPNLAKLRQHRNQVCRNLAEVARIWPIPQRSKVESGRCLANVSALQWGQSQTKVDQVWSVNIGPIWAESCATLVEFSPKLGTIGPNMLCAMLRVVLYVWCTPARFRNGQTVCLLRRGARG